MEGIIMMILLNLIAIAGLIYFKIQDRKETQTQLESNN